MAAPLLTTKPHILPLTRSFGFALRSIPERRSGQDRFGVAPVPGLAAERGLEPQTDAHLRPGRLRHGYPHTHQSAGATTLYGPCPAHTALHGDLPGIRNMSLPLISVNLAELNSKGGALPKSEGGVHTD